MAHYLLILLFLLHGSATEPRSDADIVLEEEFAAYLNEYDRFGEDSALWMIYLMLDAVPGSYATLHRVAQSREYSSLGTVPDCLPGPSVYGGEETLLQAAACFGQAVLLAYAYDRREEPALLERAANRLDPARMTPDLRLYYDVLFDDYSPDIHFLNRKIFHFLDFHYFNHAGVPVLAEIPEYLDQLEERALAELSGSQAQSAYITLVFLHFRGGNYQRVYELSPKITGYRDLPVSNLGHRIYRFISYASYVSGYYYHDIELYRNFILPQSRYLSPERYLISNLDFGTTLYRFGNTVEALRYLEYVYAQRHQLSDMRYLSLLLSNLGTAYLSQGYFERFLQFHLEALTYSEEIGNSEIELFLMNNLYLYYLNSRNWETAREYLNYMYDKALSIGQYSRIARIYVSKGYLYRELHQNYLAALEFYQQALDLSTVHHFYEIIYDTYFHLSYTYMLMGEYQQSIEILMQSLEYAQTRNDLINQNLIYVYLAERYLEAGDPETSREYLDRVDYEAISSLNFIRYSYYYFTLAKYYSVLEQPEQVVEVVEPFISDFFPRLKYGSEIQSGYIFLDSPYYAILRYYIEACIRTGNHDSALYWMEEIKNLSSFTFYNNPALKSQFLSEQELVLDYALRNRIDRLRGELAVAKPDARIQLNHRLLEAISEQNILRRKVLQNVDLEPADLSRLQRRLSRSEVILYFGQFENQLFAKTITSSSRDFHIFSFSDEELARIDSLAGSLSSDRILLTELAWLREKILDPLQIADRFTRYIVIPDGFLYHIPLDILPIDGVSNDFSYGEATWLIEKVSISYSNSLKDVEVSFAGSPARSYPVDFLGYGISDFSHAARLLDPEKQLPPLPLAEREVIDIAGVLQDLRTRNYIISEESHTSHFRNHAGNSRILHLASHSEVYEKDPLYSVLYLNPDPDQPETPDRRSDGRIYAYELFEMNLNNQMIMLNSCESGSGSYIQGSGIIGFSRALNYAGVQSLVLNLWTVRDQSAYDLSVSFYTYLNQGLTKSEAMQRAKVDYINYKNSNPSYWGSFVVYGNVDPLVRRDFPLTISIFLVALGSLLIAWIRFSRRVEHIGPYRRR